MSPRCSRSHLASFLSSGDGTLGAWEIGHSVCGIFSLTGLMFSATLRQVKCHNQIKSIFHRWVPDLSMANMHTEKSTRLEYLGVLWLCLMIALTGCEDHSRHEPKPSDKENVASVLPGTWREDDGTLYTYRPDGTASVSWTHKWLLGTDLVNVTVRWHIDDGYIYQTVTASNIPDQLPVGTTYSSKIIALNPQEFLLKDEIKNKEKRLVRTSDH